MKAKQKARVVIGANFGDEGKGLMVDYLCSQGAGVVVRFNGGAQAGHTVVTPDGERHVFHHFGSGSLLEVPTFLSQFVICNPLVFAKERNELIALGFHPLLFAHPDCLVTTFVDMAINRAKEVERGDKRHGSCGLGVHETENRSQIPHLKITMGDLWDGGKRLPEQLEEISTKYFDFRTKKTTTMLVAREVAIAQFIEACEFMAANVHPAGIGQCNDPVFEGAQGLLLDQNNKEFFPHLTHSNTGMANVNVLCQQAGIDDREIYYVSRTYLTRHGAGRLPGEDPALRYDDNTNAQNAWQGKLRFAPLDYAALRKRCYDDAGGNDYKLVFTHCDQCNAKGDADIYFGGPTRRNVVTQKIAQEFEAVAA